MHNEQATQLLSRVERLGARQVVAHCGRDVVWRRFGAGAPLVLLHGGHGSWLHWVRNIEALALRHTLWLPDMPGFGESQSLQGGPHAADRMERLLDALADTLASLAGAQTAVGLAGFSFGALVAARLAARRPVHRLALIGSAGHGGPRRLTRTLRDWRVADRAAQTAALRENLTALMLHEPAAADAAAMAIYERQCSAARFRSKAISRAGGLQDALARFAGPTLLIWGAHDVTAMPEELAPQLAAARTGIDWRIVAGAGHWAQYERADEVSALLAAWFAG